MFVVVLGGASVWIALFLLLPQLSRCGTGIRFPGLGLSTKSYREHQIENQHQHDPLSVLSRFLSLVRGVLASFTSVTMHSPSSTCTMWLFCFGENERNRIYPWYITVQTQMHGYLNAIEVKSKAQPCLQPEERAADIVDSA